MGPLESGRQLDVCKTVLAAVLQLLLKLLHGQARFQRSRTGHGPAHGLRAGLGGLLGGGGVFKHGHITWLSVQCSG